MALESGTARVVTGKKLRSRAWYRVWASADPATGMLRVGQQPLKRAFAIDDEGEASTTGASLALDVPQPAMIGAEAAARSSGQALLQRQDRGAAASPASPPGTSRAAWTALEVEDSGPNGLHGKLINLPTRAMKGASWTGKERNWQAAPHEYAAIHFHDDDLHDCGWADDFSFTVPKDMKSGVWGMQLRCGPHRDIIPFFVRPQVAKPQAKVCYLAATFTYQVYTNFSRGVYDEPFRQRVADWKAAANNPDEHKDYGLATYNYHRDGSGVAYSSHLRPLLTWRPDCLSFNDPAGSGLRHLPADTHLTGWLDRMGIAYDVVTDHDLHDKGVEILSSYKVVLTGSHPEYHTERTLDALQTYTETGGRLMYLGGNGFYWRVALSDKVPGAIEIRRTEGGIRTWAAEPGEYYHAFDGAYGGLWRRSDRPPSCSAASASRARAASSATPIARRRRRATTTTPGSSRA